MLGTLFQMHANEANSPVDIRDGDLIHPTGIILYRLEGGVGLAQADIACGRDRQTDILEE